MNIVIILIIIAILLWVASFIVRRKNYKAGVILSWSATGVAVIAFLIKLFM